MECIFWATTNFEGQNGELPRFVLYSFFMKNVKKFPSLLITTLLYKAHFLCKIGSNKEEIGKLEFSGEFEDLSFSGFWRNKNFNVKMLIFGTFVQKGKKTI